MTFPRLATVALAGLLACALLIEASPAQENDPSNGDLFVRSPSSGNRAPIIRPSSYPPRPLRAEPRFLQVSRTTQASGRGSTAPANHLDSELPPLADRASSAELAGERQPPWQPGQPAAGEYNDGAPVGDMSLFPHIFNPDQYGRFGREGEPLETASWLNRPYYAGFFLGGLNGDTLIPGEINQSIGVFGGFRLGWDYDYYWGLETRLGFSELGLDFIDEPSVDGLSTDIVIWDTSLVYYPWGDVRWRPYVSVGIGLVDFDFLDQFGLRHSDAVIGLPWGIGLKYRQSDWITLRFDLLDNVAFGGKAGFETMNNLSLTGGFEFRFGGTRKSYFPWNPSRIIR